MTPEVLSNDIIVAYGCRPPCSGGPTPATVVERSSPRKQLQHPPLSPGALCSAASGAILTMRYNRGICLLDGDLSPHTRATSACRARCREGLISSRGNERV
jgi:hypothetical protein